jgi:hypothetical protein
MGGTKGSQATKPKRPKKNGSHPSADQRQSEKWIAVQKALDLSKELGQFISKIVGPSAFALGGLLGDQMKAWRAANLARIAEKWRAKCTEHSVPPEAISHLPFRNAVLVIDAASMEDDDDVSELWAQLIFQATKAGAGNEISKMQVDLLKSLNGLEARILMLIFEMMEQEVDRDIALKKLCGNTELNDDLLRVGLLNLQRLGIISPNITEFEIIEHSTFDAWLKTVNAENLEQEFKKVVQNLVLHLTDFTGSPMNDMRIERSLFVDLVSSYSLTRIGWNLYEATGDRPG